jgi:hypothetical protein
VTDPEDPSKSIVFPAITDLYMTPELDVPIYCMQKRNSLSPLTMVPQIKVWQYAFLNNEQDEVTKLVRQRMSLDERRRFDEICGVMMSSDPWRRIKTHLKPEQQDKIEQLILRFSKPFSTETRPPNEFFRFFQIAMDKLNEIADVDMKSGIIKVKNTESKQ